MNAPIDTAPRLDFIWVELTNQCNLECVHCYSSSGPAEGDTDALNHAHYEKLVQDAHTQGCRRIQFIGGEATLYRQLPDLLTFTRDLGYEDIELYSNLISLSPRIVEVLSAGFTRVATSVYSDQAAVHDAITTRPGSWTRTIGNLKRLIDLSIPTRVSVIVMEKNAGAHESTRQFLAELGVDSVGTDRARAFGRAAPKQSQCDMRELCGNCADGVLCVSADGKVYPCVMSRAWQVGQVLDNSLETILRDQPLRHFRHGLIEHVLQRDSALDCAPLGGTGCGPDNQCSPCSPAGCSPGRECSPHAWPRPSVN
jgi:radical SAM protein with 4Fe4S-binding SPASM domain